MKKWIILLGILVVFMFVVNSVFAVPQMMNYQGRLTDASGNPVTGSKSMTFSIFGTATGGSPVWTETQNVTPDSNGITNVLLGSVTPLTSAVFDGNDRYLQVTISGEALLPRMRLVSVGYAITADNLGGGAVNVSSSGNVGINTTNPLYKLDVVGDRLRIVSSGFFGLTFGRPGFVGERQIGISEHASAPDMYFTSNAGAQLVTITNAGNVGIGTTAPTERLDVVGNIKASGTISQGSSRELKKDIANISTAEAVKALSKMSPVRFKYKAEESGKEHLGFIAEDVPGLVASSDHKHLSPMDIIAVLTKVVQEQQKMLKEQQEEIKRLKEAIGL